VPHYLLLCLGVFEIIAQQTGSGQKRVLQSAPPRQTATYTQPVTFHGPVVFVAALRKLLETKENIGGYNRIEMLRSAVVLLAVRFECVLWL